MDVVTRLRRSRWTGIALSTLLCGLYARGGSAWVLGFVALVPWLRTLNREASLISTLLSAWLMSMAFTVAVFGWFGSAIGVYTQIGAPAGFTLLLIAAPLFQPQLLAFAVVRHLTRSRCGSAIGALAGTAAWVAAEWALPRLLGDTLGHGLYPAPLLRQAAALGGATGLTLALLGANEAVAAALARRHGGLRAVALPLGLAVAVPVLLASYGLAFKPDTPSPGASTLRMGLVQSNITDYERLRREKGAGAVVREVLDTHFAMTYDAVERQHVQAVMWSETVYPTTFGQPKSEGGAALDAEILSIVNAAGVPFVFGTYDRDANGEYNAAAFVSPRSGLLGMYRKTRLFPLTEAMPRWLDTPSVRAWLPGSGTWQPGTGARVFPLRLADGREIPVLPLICLDDTDPQLAIDGARLGAQALLTMSNDSWFTDFSQGAALHQSVAAFRSIETRLPQFRVTTNGFSGIIDAQGRVIAGSHMAERTLVVGELPVHDVAPTLMVSWGDWVGRAAAVALLALAAFIAASRWRPTAAPTHAASAPMPLAGRLIVLPRGARVAAGVLRLISRASLLGMVAGVLLGDGSWAGNTLALIRSFAALCLAPEAVAWCLLRAYQARAALADSTLVLTRGSQRIELPLHQLAAVEPWRVPLPGAGASLRLTSGERWPWKLTGADPWALAAALGVAAQETPRSRAWAWARNRSQAPRSRFAQPVFKLLLLPLLMAVTAFQLHQKIAYGSALGEFYSFGLLAYVSAFALWWAAWAIGIVLCLAALRAVIEALALAGTLLKPESAVVLRRSLERAGLVLLYLGLPAWLLMRASGN